MEKVLDTVWYSGVEADMENMAPRYRVVKYGSRTDGWDHSLVEVEWYENGKKKSEGNFKHGELDALSTGWNEAGVKQWEGNFKEGKKHGSVIFYNQDGSVQSRQEWWNGREIRE